MDNRIKMLLLKILDENGDISNLEKAGYQFIQIASEYSKLINEGFISLGEKDEFVLTDIGRIELERLKHDIIQTGNWKIEPYVEYKIEKMDKFDIYIE